MRKAFDVFDRFQITGRGTVLAARALADRSLLRPSQAFDPVLADGSRQRLVATAVENFIGSFSDGQSIGILVGDQLPADVDVRDASIEVDPD